MRLRVMKPIRQTRKQVFVCIGLLHGIHRIGSHAFSQRVTAFVLLAACTVSACDKSTQDDKASNLESAGPAMSAIPQSDPVDGISQIVEVSPLNPEAAARWPSARFASAGRIESATQRSGDAEKGRKALLEEAYVNCGLPERVFRELLAGSPVVEVQGRSSKASGLPFNTNVTINSDGLSIVSNNCLTCHGTVLFGQLVLGLGNEFLDFTGNPSVLAERAGALVRGDEETRAWELYADRIGAVAPYIQTQTIGVNPANNLTFALMAHRDADTNAWSDTPLLELPPRNPPPVSVPPWWRMKNKPAMFSLGEGRLDHARIMMSASMLCSDSIEELQAIDAYAADIRAFIANLDAPAWPFEVNESLASEGRQVFEQNCSHCHGTYGDGGHYPARLVPIEQVQTDATLVDFAHGAGAQYTDWFNRSFYGRTSIMSPGAGYVAPLLDGVWATAPFLHNGSVPTIRALLDSATRPSIWYHIATDASDPGNYDTTNLGWSYEVLLSFTGTSQADAAIGKRVYDTRVGGYSNAGHLFGDHLSETARSAVLEYLKTL